jgi:2Fe-2S ferredoxin
VTREIFDRKIKVDTDLLTHETATTKQRSLALDHTTDASLREILQFTIARKNRQIKASASSVELPQIIRPKTFAARPAAPPPPASGGAANLVEFQPMNRQVATSPNTTLLATALKARIPIRHDCGGHGQCGTCRVQVIRGSNSLSPFTPPEQKLLSNLLTQNWRLACQVKTSGPIAVTVPPVKS